MSFKPSYGIQDSERSKIICSARVEMWRDSIMNLIWQNWSGARMSAAVKKLCSMLAFGCRLFDSFSKTNNIATQGAKEWFHVSLNIIVAISNV